MRLFLYYAVHSVLNALKKLLKTWVAVFIVLMIGGALIGGIIGIIVKATANTEDTSPDTAVEQTEDGEEEEVELEVSFGGGFSGFLKENDLETVNVVDFVISVAFLFILATTVANSKSSGKLFMPADVPMLFASPMRPQSVLMFRLMCSLGTSFFVSLFMLYQIPNLMNGAKLSFWGAMSCVLVYMLSLMFSTLIQVALYTLTSKLKAGPELVNKILIGFYGLIGAGFIAYITLGGEKDIKAGLFGYFADPDTLWVPFWGWLRGITYYAVLGDAKKSLFYLGLFVLALILVIILIWNIKADFYEDAMFTAERKAEQLANAKRASTGATVIREKERKGSIDREGFKYGSGANVFFYKAVFNRFRFAKLKVFSTTMIIYLLIAVAVSFVVNKYTEVPSDYFFIPCAAMGIIAFYRTLGDPIREDTSREFFILVPASGYSKIVYSLLGCLTVTAIDLIIPMIVSTVMLGVNPLIMLVWLLFILSVSFFATTVGTFISLSVPGNAGDTIKTIIQIMFLYFGLTPAAVAVIVGVIFHQLVLALLVGTAFNALTGFLVSLALPCFLGRK